jgi:hypothetical protein
LKGEQLKVVFRQYHFPQSKSGVAMRVEEQKQFLLDYKSAIDRQLEKAKRAKDKSRMIGTTPDLHTAGKSLPTVCVQ